MAKNKRMARRDRAKPRQEFIILCVRNYHRAAGRALATLKEALPKAGTKISLNRGGTACVSSASPVARTGLLLELGQSGAKGTGRSTPHPYFADSRELAAGLLRSSSACAYSNSLFFCGADGPCTSGGSVLRFATSPGSTSIPELPKELYT